MEKRLTGFVWIGLGVSLLLALFLPPFASSEPDGLEKVAEDHGFAEKERGSMVSGRAPFGKYLCPGVKDERISTAISGAIGTLAIFLFVVGAGKLLTKPKKVV